jgi:hypothetical protein
MRLLSPLLFALTLAAATACAQHATPTKPTAKVTKHKVKAAKPAKAAKANTQAEPVIVFKKTPCYGPCPEYEATIYPDGRVAYVGRSNVRLMGARELKLPAAVVSKILADAQRLSFGTLNDQYAPKNVTDLPSTIISIRQPAGQLKAVETVQADGAVPAGLQTLLDYISQELDRITGNTPPSSR